MFSIFAKLPESLEPLEPPKPPAFSVEKLTIRPAKVGIGESVTISVEVVNTGDVADSHTVTLRINGVVEETKEVTVAARSSQIISFTVNNNIAGNYEVEIAGQTGEFRVLPAPLAINWVLIGGAIAAVIVIGFIMGFLHARRTMF